MSEAVCLLTENSADPGVAGFGYVSLRGMIREKRCSKDLEVIVFLFVFWFAVKLS